MIVPDYVAPIVGYRVWDFHSSRLVSLNDEPWPPGKARKAECRGLGWALLKLKEGGMSTQWIERMEQGEQSRPKHQAPLKSCTCGIYAFKAPTRAIGNRLYGEVYLWGKVIEHKYGYRARFAYPKSFILNDELFKDISRYEILQNMLKPLTAYGVDISVQLISGTFGKHCLETVLLWTPRLGYHEDALKWALRPLKTQGKPN
jgi:hypothetical protein